MCVCVCFFWSLRHVCSLKQRFLCSLESEPLAKWYFLNVLSAFLGEGLSLMRDRCEAATREGHTCPAGPIWAAVDSHVSEQNIRILTETFRNFGHSLPRVAERVCAAPNRWQVYLVLRKSVTIAEEHGHFSYGKTEARATRSSKWQGELPADLRAKSLSLPIVILV